MAIESDLFLSKQQVVLSVYFLFCLQRKCEQFLSIKLPQKKITDSFRIKMTFFKLSF